MVQRSSKKNPPLVSLILPVYNACNINPDYLTQALESISRQTYKNFELIIVDDGSTDDSGRLCQNFVAGHPEMTVRYFYKENTGQSGARNYGAQMARGEYLCFMDQDDIGYENMLEQRMSHLDPETDLLYTDADIIDARGLTSRQAIHRNHGHGLPHPKRSLEDILFKDIVVMTGLLTIKKEIFLRVGGFDENLSGYEDDDLFLRIFEIGKIKYLPVPTLKWRVYDESCSQTDRMIKSRSYYFQKLISRYTDEGGNQKRLRTISWRFFRLFLLEASRQLDQNKKLFGENMAGVRKTLPMISPHRRIFFHLLFLLEGEKAVRLFRWIYQKRRRLLMSSFFSYEFS